MSYEKHEVSFHIMFRKTGNKKKRSEKDNSKYVTVTKLHISWDIWGLATALGSDETWIPLFHSPEKGPEVDFW